jgi:hypothetical protein
MPGHPTRRQPGLQTRLELRRHDQGVLGPTEVVGGDQQPRRIGAEANLADAPPPEVLGMLELAVTPEVKPVCVGGHPHASTLGEGEAVTATSAAYDRGQGERLVEGRRI